MNIIRCAECGRPITLSSEVPNIKLYCQYCMQQFAVMRRLLFGYADWDNLYMSIDWFYNDPRVGDKFKPIDFCLGTYALKVNGEAFSSPNLIEQYRTKLQIGEATIGPKHWRKR